MYDTKLKYTFEGLVGFFVNLYISSTEIDYVEKSLAFRLLIKSVRFVFRFSTSRS